MTWKKDTALEYRVTFSIGTLILKREKAITFHVQVGIELVSFTRRKCGVYDGLDFVNLVLRKNISSYYF